MTKRLALVAGTALLAACEGAGVDDGVRTVGSDVVGANGLTSNGLTSNGLTSNGLTSNGLTSNGLGAGKMTATTLSALRDKTATGDVTRTFFRYLVSCALPAGRSVTYAWTDAAGAPHTEIVPGGFNLAPTWETGAVDTAGQEWVSACLFARTNTLGLQVPISIRANGPIALAVTTQERVDYPYGEGAFWGNLFLSTPIARSCSRAPFRSGTSTSADLQRGRTCASEGCGVVMYVGPCFTSTSATTGQACFQRAANNDWVSDCNTGMNASHISAPRVISTWLR